MTKKSSRKLLIAGNWKMNKTPAESVSLIKDIIAVAERDTLVNVALCPPFTSLDCASQLLSKNHVWLGAQNMHPEPSGAFTGEVSASMLKSLFVTCVILGHSERRMYFGETDAFINKKVLAALENNLRPILCVGETLEEREKGHTMDVISKQIQGGLADVSEKKVDSLIIAYEPVWAIGTGRTATPDMAQEVHSAIRDLLSKRFSKELAEKVRILYGGSMKPDNASSLLEKPDVDGGLIGGASLEPKGFLKIIESAISLSH